MQMMEQIRLFYLLCSKIYDIIHNIKYKYKSIIFNDTIISIFLIFQVFYTWLYLEFLMGRTEKQSERMAKGDTSGSVQSIVSLMVSHFRTRFIHSSSLFAPLETDFFFLCLLAFIREFEIHRDFDAMTQLSFQNPPKTYVLFIGILQMLEGICNFIPCKV